MIEEKRNFGKVSYSVSSLDRLTADNNQHVIDLYANPEDSDFYHKPKEIVTAIPLEECYTVITDEDLSKYGFKKIKGNLWKNERFIQEARIGRIF